MKITKRHNGVEVELTRRNLETLLKKLDYNAGLLAAASASVPSRCRLIAPTDSEMPVVVAAVEDAEHYADREPGEMLDNATGEVY